MVQIIQSQPTQRQSALEQALGQAVQGFGQSYLQGQQTLRQQALLEKQQQLDATKELLKGGYEVTPQNLALMSGKEPTAPVVQAAQPEVAAQPAQFEATQLQGPVQPGKMQLGTYDKQVKEATPFQPARPEVLGPKPTALTYTAAKQAEIDAKKTQEKLTQQVLQSRAERAPLEQQKLQEDINRIQVENKNKPIEMAAKIADTQYKHSLMAEKVDQKTNDRFSKLAKDVSNPTMRSALGAFGKNLASADRIKVLTEAYTAGAKPGSAEEINGLNALSSQQAEEVTKSLDTLISGGTSTVSGAEHLRFNTLKSQWADLKAKYGNNPQGAELGAFLSRALETVDRERQYNQKQVERILGGIGEGYSDLKRKDPERFNKIIGAAYSAGEEQPLSSQAPQAPISHPDTAKNARLQELLAKANK